MDMKSPHKRNDGKLSKPSVVSPVKGHGKITLGFRGFKLNSKIKLLKQVDVKTQISKPKPASETEGNATSKQYPSPQKKLTTAESLKQLREKIQAKTKLQEELNASDSEKDSLTETSNIFPNGVHSEKSAEASPSKITVEHSKPKSPEKAAELAAELTQVAVTKLITSPAKSDSSKYRENRSPSSSRKRDDSTEHKTSPKKSGSSKDRGNQSQSKDAGKSKRPTDGSELKSKSEKSSSSRSRSHKHNSSYRRNRGRSRSPHRKREHRSSKGKSFDKSTERSGYSHRDKSSHSSVKESSSRRSSYFRKREPTYTRKYSASHESRNNENSKTHSRSHEQYNAKRRSHNENDSHRKRSSSHRRSSSERFSHSNKQSTGSKTPSERSNFSASRKDKGRSDERPKQAEQRPKHTAENKKHTSKVELFSKLSFAMLNEDEEGFEEELDSFPRRETDNEAFDTDLESLPATKSTKAWSVNSTSEEEFPNKVIDEILTDNPDFSSTNDDNDTDLEDVESVNQDTISDAVDLEMQMNELSSRTISAKTLDTECSTETLSQNDELGKVTELSPTDTNFASIELNSDVIIDIVASQNFGSVKTDVQHDVAELKINPELMEIEKDNDTISMSKNYVTSTVSNEEICSPIAEPLSPILVAKDVNHGDKSLLPHALSTSIVNDFQWDASAQQNAPEVMQTESCVDSSADIEEAPASADPSEELVSPVAEPFSPVPATEHVAEPSSPLLGTNYFQPRSPVLVSKYVEPSSPILTTKLVTAGDEPEVIEQQPGSRTPFEELSTPERSSPILGRKRKASSSTPTLTTPTLFQANSGGFGNEKDPSILADNAKGTSTSYTAVEQPEESVSRFDLVKKSDSTTPENLPVDQTPIYTSFTAREQSPKAPLMLTEFAKGILPTTEAPENLPVKTVSSVKAEQLSPKPRPDTPLSSENRIPTLASQLKTVFKSLLQTDFKAEDGETNIETLPVLNGVISHNKTQFLECDSARRAKAEERSGGVEKAEDTVVAVPSGKLQDRSMKADREDVTSSIIEPAKVESEVGTEKDYSSGANSFAQCRTPTHTAGSIITVTNFSPDKACKASPHKLKLHATTRTPLPAKKSYIQQVQSNSENSRTNSPESGIFSLAAKLLMPSDSEAGGISSASDAELQEAKPVVDSILSTLETETKESKTHCEGNTTLSGNQNEIKLPVPGLSLSRQDSSGSSANDNEEGPRRSARIRTKKTERTLKKQLSLESTQFQNLPTNNNALENPPESKSAISFQNYLPESLPKDLSGEELFKARIRVAPDTTECPDPFEILDENLYLMSTKKSRARKEIRRMVCDCAFEDIPDPDGPCGENCLNRLLMIECSSRCHYGDSCTNKSFQHRRYAAAEVFRTSFKGWGIRAAADIEPGQLVMEYCGEVVDQWEFTRRSLEYSKSNHAHFYFMALSQDEVIDATYKGNSSRFINHSCDPNAETQKWTVNGRLRVGFFTLRRIEKGEEITFDYQFERYGKVAQKCFCGTAKCRGYLGKAPDKDDEDETKMSKLLSNEALSPYDNETSDDDSPEKDGRKKKKLALFADNTMEKDISKLLGGLRSSKEVLTLSRLMVRCDTHAQRIMCLQVLKETTSQTRLRTFLQFHGLSIIWSWMVDIGAVEDSDALALKLEIINTLCILPITNKNVIEDSKVLSVVQRWAKPETEDKPASQEEDIPKEEDVLKQEMKEGDAAPVVDGDKEKAKSESIEPTATIVSTTTRDVITKNEEASKEEPTDEVKDTSDNHDTNNHDNDDLVETNEKVLTAAVSLLDSWKDLREIYRIPKRQKPLPSPNRDSNSRDNSLSRTSSPTSKQSRTDVDSEQRANRVSRSRRDSSQERWRDRDSIDRSWDYKYRDRRTDFTENQFSPGSSNSSDNRKEAGRRKRRFSTDSDDFSRDLPWHCRPPRNNFKVSRQEHRRRFEKDVEKREHEKRRTETGMVHNSVLSMNNRQFIGGMPEDIQPLMSQDFSMVEQAMSASATFTPSGFSGNLIQINPTQPAQLMVDSYLNIGQQVGVLPQLVQQQNAYTVQVPVQQTYDVTGMYGEDPNLQAGAYALNDPNLLNQQHINQAGQQIFTNSVNMVQPVLQHQQQVAMPQPQQQPTNNVTILGAQNGQAIVLLSAEQLQKLTQGDLSGLKESFTQGQSSSKDSNDKQEKSDTSANDSSKDKIPQKLPPNWKTATDAEGRVYYYHMITRQTQWDPPTWDGKEEDMFGKKEAEMDLSSTPTHDERWIKSSKTKSTGITEEGRKAKDSFRLRMSQFVVQCLSSYRKPDKKIGRITSTEDFKHVARKLTHNIMEKELKQVRVWEDLVFDANVKHKTKEYVKKYMGKVGPIYRIKDDT